VPNVVNDHYVGIFDFLALAEREARKFNFLAELCLEDCNFEVDPQRWRGRRDVLDFSIVKRST
jgi:hypothetical protein